MPAPDPRGLRERVLTSPQPVPIFPDQTVRAGPRSYPVGTGPLDLEFVDDPVGVAPPPAAPAPQPGRPADLFAMPQGPVSVENPEMALLLRELPPEEQGQPLLDGFESTRIDRLDAPLRQPPKQAPESQLQPGLRSLVCGQCRTPAPSPRAAFCDACGAKLPRPRKKAPSDETKKCRECGFTKTLATKSACGNCGCPLR